MRVTTPPCNERPTLTQLAPKQTTTRRAKTYKQEAKNAKALTQAMAWLKAAGIKAEPSTTEGCHLAVKTLDGATLQVAVLINQQDPTPIGSNLVVLAGDLTSRHSALALKTFQSITIAAGYGARKPIDRGPEPERKLMYDDEFELVAMRHKEFRKVPNPSAEELLAFDRVINKAVSRFVYINQRICLRHAIQASDLKTYAQVWACNYLGLYRVAEPTDNDNERKMYAHLCQRFGNFIEILLKKERNCIPDAHAASIALTGRPYEPLRSSLGRIRAELDASLEESFEDAALAELEGDVFDMDAEALMAPELGMTEVPHQLLGSEEEREQKLSDARRRKLAQSMLKQALAAMPHDQMIQTLETTAANPHLCYDARAEAKKQLRIHREDCSSCPKTEE